MDILKTEKGFTFPVSPFSSRSVFVHHDGSYGIRRSLWNEGVIADPEDTPKVLRTIVILCNKCDILLP